MRERAGGLWAGGLDGVGLAGGHSGTAAPRFGSRAHNAWASRRYEARARVRASV